MDLPSNDPRPPVSTTQTGSKGPQSAVVSMSTAYDSSSHAPQVQSASVHVPSLESQQGRTPSVHVPSLEQPNPISVKVAKESMPDNPNVQNASVSVAPEEKTGPIYADINDPLVRQRVLDSYREFLAKQGNK